MLFRSCPPPAQGTALVYVKNFPFLKRAMAARVGRCLPPRLRVGPAAGCLKEEPGRWGPPPCEGVPGCPPRTPPRGRARGIPCMGGGGGQRDPGGQRGSESIGTAGDGAAQGRPSSWWVRVRAGGVCSRRCSKSLRDSRVPMGAERSLRWRCGPYGGSETGSSSAMSPSCPRPGPSPHPAPERAAGWRDAPSA